MEKEKQLILIRKIKIYVFEDDTELRKNFYRRLRDFAYHSRHMANDMMNAFASDVYVNKLNKENEVQTNTLQESFESSQQNLGYKITTNKYKELLPSAIRASLSQKVYKDFKNNIKDILSGKRSFTSYKQDIPIFFMKKSILNLKKLEDKNYTFQLFGTPFKTILGRDKSNNEAIIDSIIEGKYDLADSSIQFKDNELFLNITYKQKFILQEDKLDVNKILGVDLGMVFPAYVSIFGTKVKQAIGNSQDFLNQRTKIFSRRRMINKNLQQTSGGKGRKHKLKKLNQSSESEKNFVTTYNHFVSKKIIDAAIQNGCGVINIEKLEGIAKEEKNKFILRNWSYFQLVSMIKYKTQKYGITLREIDPSFTSQRCSKCGHIHQDNRLEQGKFICMNCAFTENADYNASQNICIAHTDAFITQIEEYKKLLKKNKSDNINLADFSEVNIEVKKTKKIKNKVA